MPSHDRSPGLRWPARQVNAALDSYSLGASCQRLENDTNTVYSDDAPTNADWRCRCVETSCLDSRRRSAVETVLCAPVFLPLVPRQYTLAVLNQYKRVVYGRIQGGDWDTSSALEARYFSLFVCWPKASPSRDLLLAEGQPISFAIFRWLSSKTRVFVGIFIDLFCARDGRRDTFYFRSPPWPYILASAPRATAWGPGGLPGLAWTCVAPAAVGWTRVRGARARRKSPKTDIFGHNLCQSMT